VGTGTKKAARGRKGKNDCCQCRAGKKCPQDKWIAVGQQRLGHVVSYTGTKRGSTSKEIKVIDVVAAAAPCCRLSLSVAICRYLSLLLLLSAISFTLNFHICLMYVSGITPGASLLNSRA
jgi:hypothetical protein